MDLREIRSRSTAFATQLGYETNARVPLLDQTSVARGTEAVADRFLSLYAVVATSYGLDARKARAWLDSEYLIGNLTPRELGILTGEAGPVEVSEMRWRVESLWALAWSLRCHNELSFAESCDDAFVNILPDIANHQSATDFRQSLSLRESADIVQAADLAYCLHWAIVDAELRARRTPGLVPANVVIARRQALEWLISDATWDEVRLDT